MIVLTLYALILQDRPCTLYMYKIHALVTHPRHHNLQHHHHCLASINPGQYEVHILITRGTFQTLQATQSPIASWIQWESILAKFAQSLKAIKSCEFRDSFIKVGGNEDVEIITRTAMRLHLFFRLLLFLLLLEQNHCILYQGAWKVFRDFPFVVFVRVWPISINPTSLSNCFNFLDTSWNLMPIISTKLS